MMCNFYSCKKSPGEASANFDTGLANHEADHAGTLSRTSAKNTARDCFF